MDKLNVIHAMGVLKSGSYDYDCLEGHLEITGEDNIPFILNLNKIDASVLEKILEPSIEKVYTYDLDPMLENLCDRVNKEMIEFIKKNGTDNKFIFDDCYKMSLAYYHLEQYVEVGLDARMFGFAYVKDNKGAVRAFNTLKVEEQVWLLKILNNDI